MKRITKIENDTKGSRKTRVAAYCRVSTDSDEQLVSLEAQKQHYETYIGANPEWENAGIYYDEGITGTKKDKRPALKRMLKDCENGRIDLIVTKSISRFARNTTDCLELVRWLSEMGIYIYFERENINTQDMEGELMLTILSSLAEEESVSISQNTRWSVQKRYRKGTFIIGYPPYGYRNSEGTMEIVEEEGEVVRDIFASFLSGKSTNVIAAELREKGIKTKKNGQWRPETVNAMLKNEKYAGDVIFQKTWTDERFNRHINHGEMDQYVVRDHHEPIIAREDFEAVQALMDQRFGEKGGERGTDKYGQRYAFSGKIICGECGSTFRRKIQKRAGQNYIIWSCHRHIEDKDRCRMKAVTQETVETAFMTMMNKLAFAKEEMLRPLLEEIGSFDRTEGVGRINELEQKIEENVRRREHLRSMLTQGLLDADIFNSENNLLLAETDQAETELSDLKAGIREQLTIIAELEKLIKHLGSGQMMTVFDEHIFTEYADHIVVRSRSCIEIVLKCGLHLKEAI